MTREHASTLNALLAYACQPTWVEDFCEEHGLDFEAICEAARELADEAGEDPFVTLEDAVDEGGRL